jgi:hypothetical protein
MARGESKVIEGHAMHRDIFLEHLTTVLRAITTPPLPRNRTGISGRVSDRAAAGDPGGLLARPGQVIVEQEYWQQLPVVA